MIAQKTEKDWLTTVELAERWDNINPGTLRHWRSKGKGPKFLKFMNKVRYPMDEVKKWEKKHGVEKLIKDLNKQSKGS